MKKMKENKGITLVALVVTIIILIILAGITFNLILGEDGIITKARTAKSLYEDARDAENEKLEVYANAMNTGDSYVEYVLPGKLLVDISTTIDKISSDNNENDFTFNVYLNNSNEPYKENITELNEEMDSGTKIRVVANSVEGYTTSFDETATIGNNNVSIRPTWSINKYDVTFITNGGSEIAKQIIDYGDCATRPEDPTKENNRFDSWYTEEGFTNEYKFSTPVKSTVNLYAKWMNITDTPQVDITIFFEKAQGKTRIRYTDINGQEQTAEPTSDGQTLSVVARKNTNFYLISDYGASTQWAINQDKFNKGIQKVIGTTEMIHFVVPDIDISFKITGKYSGSVIYRKIYGRSYDLSFIAD